MKDDAVIVNIARGPVINTEDLIAALSQRPRLSAALDVTDPEPLPDSHPILLAERVLVTPHYAGTTTSHERRFDLITTNIRRFLSDRPLVNKIDNILGY